MVMTRYNRLLRRAINIQDSEIIPTLVAAGHIPAVVRGAKSAHRSDDDVLTII